MSKSLGQRAFVASSWQLVSVFAQSVCQLGVLAFLARILSPSDFGVIALAGVFIAFATTISEGGVKSAVIQRHAISEDFVKTGFYISVLAGLFCCVILAFASPFLANFFNSASLGPVLCVVALSFFVQSFSIVSEALLEKNLLAKKVFIANIISYIFGYSLVAVVLATLGYGVWALAIGTLVQACLKTSLLLFSQPLSREGKLSFAEAKKIFGYGSGSSLSWFFNCIALQADNLIVGKLLGQSALGVYQMAFVAMNMQRKFIASVLEKVVFPSLSLKQHEPKQLKSIYLRCIELINVVLIPTSLLSVLMSPEIVDIILGDGWESVVLPMQLLLLQAPLRSNIRTADSLMFALGRVYQNAVRKGIYAVSIVSLSAVGAIWAGIPGVAAGVGVAILLNLGLTVHYALKISNIGAWEYLLALVPGLRVGLLFAIVNYGFLLLLRQLDVHAFAVLLALAILNLLLIVLLLRFAYRIFGNSLGWILSKLENKTGLKIKTSYAVT